MQGELRGLRKESEGWRNRVDSRNVDRREGGCGREGRGERGVPATWPMRDLAGP